MIKRRLLSVLNISLLNLSAIAQTYPKQYFRNPLEIPIVLAGNFGECRPNHFHSGIDIKTQNKENLKVLAAAEGYISRINISHSGYGNCLYVTHPNGYTTVYGHLNKFNPTIMAYLQKVQYEQKKWNVDITLKPNEIPVNKGTFIAYSGNTGGSTAPHLHFEIRDSKSEHALNPLLFGFEVTDTKAPIIGGIAIYDASSSINSQQPKIVSASGANNKFTAPLQTVNIPKIRLGIEAKDYVNNSANWLGIATLNLYDNNANINTVTISKIDFSINRAVNAFADYGTERRTGKWYQGLYQLPNNPLDYYSGKKDGCIDLSDGAVHQIKIEAIDAFGNKSDINFPIQYKVDGGAIKKLSGTYEVNVGERKLINAFNNRIYLQFEPNSLYDHLLFDIKNHPTKTYSEHFEILPNTVPLRENIKIGIRLNQLLAFELRNKLVAVHPIKAANLPGVQAQTGQSAVYDNGYATFTTKTLGDYYITIDTVSPVIQALSKGSNNKLQFKVSDQLTSVTSVQAFINDQWVCMSRVKDVYTYEFDENCPKGNNRCTIVAIDENDNKNTLNFTFIR